MKNCFAVAFCFLLAGCGGGPGGDYDHDYNPAPVLVGFDVVDSYGVDTAASLAPLAINPYKDDGLFDLFWRVNSLEDYRVNFYINDSISLSNAVMIYSEVCGAGHNCDQNGNLICQYTSDFYMACGNSFQHKDIAFLFKQVPQKLYMTLEICDMDSPYCVSQFYPVSME